MALYTIAVDAMGGDNAPGAIVEGCLLALRRFQDVRILLAGPEKTLEPLLTDAQDVRDRLEILPAADVIDPHEAPVMAVRRKTDSSMVRCALAVKEGQAQAMVSAGSTGALLACGMLRVGRIPGIDRPALATVLPGVKKPFLLLDCGANVDCQPDYLRQFGLMGSIYMQCVLGVKNPRVCLTNIGEEPEKGNRVAKEAHQLMSAQRVYQFCGNIEGREIPSGDADVVVADGFDGNLILKYTEGLSGALVGMLKEELMKSTRSKLGALLIKPALRGFKARMDYEQYGGAPLLGVRGVVFKAHGSSGAQALMNAVRQARAMLEGDVLSRLERDVARLTKNEEEEENV